MKMIKINSKMVSVFILLLTVFMMTGCSNGKGKYTDLSTASEKTKQLTQGEITQSSEMIPAEGTLEFLKETRKNNMELSFLRKENSSLYRYTVTNEYQGATEQNTFLRNEDGYFLLAGEQLITLTDPEIDYVDNLLQEILVNYTEEDTKSITVKKEDDLKAYTVTFSEDYVKKLRGNSEYGTQAVTNTYWVDKDGYITKVMIDKKELLEYSGQKDTVKTRSEYTIQKTEGEVSFEAE